MAVPYYGDFPEDHTGVKIPFNTFSSDDPSKSCTITELADSACRSIFKGFGGANDNVEIVLNTQGAKFKNCAIYNMGDHGISIVNAALHAENVNIGVETANADDDIFINNGGTSIARDLKLGGTNGDVDIYTLGQEEGGLISVNHNKVLGAWKRYFYLDGVAEKVAVTGVTPNKKLSDNVIEYTPATASTYEFKEIEQKNKIFESRKTYDAGTYNIKIWIYNDTGNTLNDTTFSDDILMRCRAEAGSYDATNPDSSLTGQTDIAYTDDDPDTITDASDGFVAAGFQVNDKIRVYGSTSNDGDYTIAGVAVGVLTLVAGDSLTAEIAGDTTRIDEIADKYVSMPWTYSDEIDILDAADADDWDYLQCDSVVVDVSGSKIYCEVLVSTYDAQADVILIDPQTANP